jgi:hypothetical protein
MKKKLDTTAIMNELRGASPFFPAKQEAVQEKPVIPQTEPSEQNKAVVPRYHDTVTPSNHDTMIPEEEEVILEAVRRSVKQIGKEPATQRLTLEEKQNLKDIEYSYSRQGIKTSGNEIIRIATNYIVREYQKNGEISILAKVLKRLNS